MDMNGLEPQRDLRMRLPKTFQRVRPREISFANDKEMQRIAPLVDEFLKNILFDEEPLFISDEATIWDVSLGPDAEEILKRCKNFYGVLLPAVDLNKSLWVLIEQLNQSRIEMSSK
jgi:hypothetical protein